MSILKSTNTGELHYYEKLTPKILKDKGFTIQKQVIGDYKCKTKIIICWKYTYRIFSIEENEVYKIDCFIYQDYYKYVFEYNFDGKLYQKEIRHVKDFVTLMEYFDCFDVNKKDEKLEIVHKQLKNPRFHTQPNYSIL